MLCLYRLSTLLLPLTITNLHPPQEVWDLRVSNASWCHHREDQNRSPERFHSPFPAGGMNFSPRSGMRSPWQFSSDTWKLISSVFTWLLKKKKKKPSLSFLNFALFPLPSHCLARICSDQCLKCCITSTSCVCLPLYNVSLIVFLNCKLLWIKVSAKWSNVIVFASFVSRFGWKPLLNNKTRLKF